MRLLLRYRTDDGQHPDSDVTPQQVRKIFGTLGWIPRESDFARQKLTEVIGKLPDTIRDEVIAGDPVLITPRPGLWGIVSSETEHQLYIRLIDHELTTLRSLADLVVDAFPRAFRQETGRDPGFDSEVAIRRFDSEVRLVVGKVEEQHTAGFWQYARMRRRREFLVALLLSFVVAACIGGSIVMFLFTPTVDGDYWRAYLDRTGTAFLAAVLTTLVNIVFDFRSWRDDKRRINWAD
jgi:hypothetical protein